MKIGCNFSELMVRGVSLLSGPPGKPLLAQGGKRLDHPSLYNIKVKYIFIFGILSYLFMTESV
jgi:hypothetical protein